MRTAVPNSFISNGSSDSLALSCRVWLSPDIRFVSMKAAREGRNSQSTSNVSKSLKTKGRISLRAERPGACDIELFVQARPRYSSPFSPSNHRFRAYCAMLLASVFGPPTLAQLFESSAERCNL